MSFIPKPQEIYKHFKGNLYQITAVAEHTETGEKLVVYQALYGDFKTYARPLAMFTDRVDREKYPDAEQEFRFELQGPEARRQREETEAPPESPVRESPIQEATVQETPVQETPVQEAPVQENAAPKAEDRTASVSGSEDAAGAGESGLDPLVLEFLDAEDHAERLNILAGLHHRITDDMITTMAIACDVEIEEGDLEKRYQALRTCLVTRERYECNRLR